MNDAVQRSWWPVWLLSFLLLVGILWFFAELTGSSESGAMEAHPTEIVAPHVQNEQVIDRAESSLPRPDVNFSQFVARATHDAVRLSPAVIRRAQLVASREGPRRSPSSVATPQAPPDNMLTPNDALRNRPIERPALPTPASNVPVDEAEALSSSDISRVIRRAWRQLVACRDPASATSDQMLMVAVQVSSSGQVLSAVIDDDSLAARCVETVFTRLRFPSFSAPNLTFSFPVRL